MRKTRPKLAKHSKIKLRGGPFNGQHLKMSGDDTLVFRIKKKEYGYYKKNYLIAEWIPVNKGS